MGRQAGVGEAGARVYMREAEGGEGGSRALRLRGAAMSVGNLEGMGGWLAGSIDRSIKPEERRGARPGQEGRKPNQGKVGDDREKGEGRHPTNQPRQLAPSTGPSSRRRILDHAYSS